MPFQLRALPALLLAALATAAAAQASYDNHPETKAALQRLATEDAQVQRSRWGDLAPAAGKPWINVMPGDVGSVWRHPRWVVPGAVMRYHRGFCIAAQCQGTDYLVQYNEQKKQLEFFEKDALAYTGKVQEDGSVRLVGTGLVGVLTAETLRLDPATGTLFADKHELRAGTGAQLHAASRGVAGDPAAAGPAQAGTSDAELRAELDAMKAKVEAMRRQLEQQGPAPRTAASDAKPLTPAQQREADRRAQREAQARAAEEKRLAAEAKAREDAQRRAEAQARTREEAQARAAEAKRLAEEKKARQEAERRAAEEAREEQKRRVAEEKRAREEAARQAKQEQLAAKSAPAAPAPAAAKTNACGGIDGIYGLQGGDYRIEVKFGDDALVVREPNRTSTYRHLGQCQYGFTHPNGTEYRLGVVPKAMVAYKPGQSESQKRHLALLQAAAAPQASNKCKGEEIPVLNPGALHPGLTRLFGTRTLPGVALAGTYAAPEPNGRPHTILNADGTGVFEVYGAPKPQYVHQITSWHIQVNCDGSPVTQDFPAAKVYYLVFKVSPAYQGQEWQRTGYFVRPDRVSIDDRVRR